MTRLPHNICNIGLGSENPSENQIHRSGLALQSCSEVGSKVTAFQSHLLVVGSCISKLN